MASPVRTSFQSGGALADKVETTARGTPGPWFVDRREEHGSNSLDVLSIVDGGVVTVTTVMSENDLTDIERADAARIAAVPALEATITGAITRIDEICAEGLFGTVSARNPLPELRALQDALRAALPKAID